MQSPPVASFNAKDWAAAFSSQPGEFDYWIEEVEGTIPEYLQGTLFRNGPGNFGAPPCPSTMLRLHRALMSAVCSSALEECALAGRAGCQSRTLPCPAHLANACCTH